MRRAAVLLTTMLAITPGVAGAAPTAGAAPGATPDFRPPRANALPIPPPMDLRDDDAPGRALDAYLTRPREQGGAGMTSIDDLLKSRQAASTAPADVHYAQAVPAGDIDADGYEDVLTIEYAWTSLALVARRGTTSTPIYEVTLDRGGTGPQDPYRQQYILLADNDGDGVLELTSLSIARRSLGVGYTLDQVLTVHDDRTGAPGWTWQRNGSVLHQRGSPSPRHGTFVTRLDDVLVIAGVIADVSGDGRIDPFVQTCDAFLVFVREDEIRSEGTCTGTHLDAVSGAPIAETNLDVRTDLPLMFPVGDLDGDARGDLLVFDPPAASGATHLDALTASGARLWEMTTPPVPGMFVFLVPLHAGHLDILLIAYDWDAFAVADARDGATGTSMWTWDYYAEDGGFTFAGDVAGDGGNDILTVTRAGSVVTLRTLRGETRTVEMWTRDLQTGDAPDSYLEIWTLSDLNRDGAEEIAALPVTCDPEGSGCSSLGATALDGRTGAVSWQIDRDMGYGLWAVGGDVDADGVADLQSARRTGADVIVDVASGADGRLLRSLNAEQGADYAGVWAADLAPAQGDELVLHSGAFWDVITGESADGRLWELRYGDAA